MKVILKRNAIYEFNSEKYTPIPNGIFNMLVDPEHQEVVADDEKMLPKVIYFSNREDYIKNHMKYDIDETHDIYASIKGPIFCFLKGDVISDETENQERDGSTDTEKNQSEES